MKRRPPRRVICGFAYVPCDRDCPLGVCKRYSEWRMKEYDESSIRARMRAGDWDWKMRELRPRKNTR